MGAANVKPADPDNTDAKIKNDLAIEGLELAGKNFLQEVLLHIPSEDTVGYELVNNRFTDQEIQLSACNSTNVTSQDIKDGIHSLFTKDWESLINVAADEIVKFLNGAEDNASANVWKKSFLIWEKNSLVQYSAFIKKTKSSSVGTTAANQDTTMLSVACRGVVNYETIDPQTIIYELTKADPSYEKDSTNFNHMMDVVTQELQRAAQLAQIKRAIRDGVVVKN